MATKEAEREYVAKPCETCKTVFMVQRQSIMRGEGRYCSRACSPHVASANAARVKNPIGRTNEVVTRTCPTCKGEFSTKVKNINRGGGVYCSKECNPKSSRNRRLPAEHHEKRRREYGLLKSYGLTMEEYDTMVEKQGGVCAICSSPPKGQGSRSRYLYVDHCHTTGVVRGLLCRNCNNAIGLLSDDTEILSAAIRYLEKA